MPRITVGQRRALALLAGSGDGVTDSMLLTHWVSRTVIAELIQAGLASATLERVIAGKNVIEVRRVSITDAGRRAIET